MNLKKIALMVVLASVAMCVTVEAIPCPWVTEDAFQPWYSKILDSLKGAKGAHTFVGSYQNYVTLHAQAQKLDAQETQAKGLLQAQIAEVGKAISSAVSSAVTQPVRSWMDMQFKLFGYVDGDPLRAAAFIQKMVDSPSKENWEKVKAILTTNFANVDGGLVKAVIAHGDTANLNYANDNPVKKVHNGLNMATLEAEIKKILRNNWILAMTQPGSKFIDAIKEGISGWEEYRGCTEKK